MRELVSSTTMAKPIIALVEPDAPRGGLSLEEVRAQLLEAEGSYAKWGFDATTTPSGPALYDHLFANEAIEWNRGHPCRDLSHARHTIYSVCADLNGWQRTRTSLHHTFMRNAMLPPQASAFSRM